MNNLAKKYAQALFESIEKKEDKKEIEVILDNFVKELVKNNKESQLKQIIDQFNYLWNKNKKVTEAKIISAQKLDKKIIDNLKKYIKEKTNSNEVEIIEDIDKEIKGGIILHFDGKIIDLSLKNKLLLLKNTLNS